MDKVNLAKTPGPRRPSRWRKRILLAGSVVLVSLCWLSGVHLYSRITASRDLQEAIADLDHLEADWRFEEIQGRRRVVPEERNGARRVLAAKALLPKHWPAWEDPHSPESQGLKEEDRETLRDIVLKLDPVVQLNEQQIRVLRSELQKVTPARIEARKLVDYLHGRYTIDWKLDFPSTLLPDVQDTREVVKLLTCDALLRAHDQDVEGAWVSGLAALNVSRSIGDEPFLIGQLVRAAEVVTALHSFERTLAQGQPAEDGLATVQHLLQVEDEETPALFLNALRGERALVHRMLEAFEAGELTFAQILAEPSKGSLRDTAKDFLMVPVVQYAHAAYLRDMTEWINVFHLPVAEQAPRIQAVKTVIQLDEKALFSRLMIPNTDRVMAVSPRKQAYLRCAIVALAAERYRQAQGQWPDSLAALTPRQLRQVPTDPYDGAPLRFRRLKASLVVYSVGPDAQDDGGSLDRKNPVAPGTDLGFRLWDVPHRRLPF
jgi:hypothetical protein